MGADEVIQPSELATGLTIDYVINALGNRPKAFFIGKTRVIATSTTTRIRHKCSDTLAIEQRRGLVVQCARAIDRHPTPLIEKAQGCHLRSPKIPTYSHRASNQVETITDTANGPHRSQWFALFQEGSPPDDYTVIHGVRRGKFRLHPVGYWGKSEGCITLLHPSQFDTLRKWLTAQPPENIPGTQVTYYGTVIVR